MNPASIRLGVIITLIWRGKYSDASPVVTLSTNRSIYFSEGGSLALSCELNQYVGPSRIWFKRNGLNWIWIRNSSACELQKVVQSDHSTYSITCDHSRRFMLVIDGVNARDHKTTWRCEIASYNDGPCSGGDNLCISESLTVFQRIPVTTVHLTDESGQPLASPVTVVDGASQTFTCDTSPNGSRPSASFLWYKRKENQTETLIEDQSNISTPDLIPVPEQPETELLISYNTLILTFEKSYQKMNIFCAAQDKTYTGTYIDSKEIQINIVYPPVITLLPNSSVFTVREGDQNFGITCYITDVNPRQQPDVFTWLYNEKVIHGQTSSSYMIQNVQRSDAGQYKCKASNSYGTGSSKSLKLNVQYGAKITDLSVVGGDVVNENGTVKLSCFVDSNPVSDITWVKEGSKGPLKTDFSVLQSHLVFNRAQCLDASNYTCKASNGLGITVERRIPLHVTCHPRTDFRSPPVIKVYSKRRGDAELRYTVISYPDPTFVWTLIGNGGEKRVLPESSTQNDDDRQSTLTFSNLNVEDFGFYSVTATNQFAPPATVRFELIVADVPETPSNMTVVEVTQKTLTVQWLAGHSGGPEQTFHVVASAGDFTRSVYAADPGYGRVGTTVIEGLSPNTKYNIYVSANNTVFTSNISEAITVYTPGENRMMGLLFLGGVAVAVVFIVVAIAIFIIKRRRYCRGTSQKQGKQSRQSNEHGTEMSQVNINTVQGIEVTGEHEDLEVDKTNENPYSEAYDVIEDYSATKNIRLPEFDAYEELHMYANSQDQYYSTVKPRKGFKGVNRLFQRHNNKK